LRLAANKTPTVNRYGKTTRQADLAGTITMTNIIDLKSARDAHKASLETSIATQLAWAAEEARQRALREGLTLHVEITFRLESTSRPT
jgi:hypothetical protein